MPTLKHARKIRAIGLFLMGGAIGILFASVASDWWQLMVLAVAVVYLAAWFNVRAYRERSAAKKREYLTGDCNHPNHSSSAVI